MKTLAIIALAMMASVIGRAETGFLDRSIAFKGETFRYQVYVPLEYTAEKAWPVIVYLHGATREGSDGLKQTWDGLADAIRQGRSRFPVIVVFPQAKVGTRWLFPGMQELAMAELDRTAAEFHTDPLRVYLAGHSGGAVGSYRIAFRWPERFAAVVTTAGSVQSSPTVLSEADIKLDHEANVFTAAGDPFQALAAKIRTLPMLIFHGDADQMVPVQQSRKLNEALKKVGANAKYVEFPGVDHGGTQQKAWADPDTITWLLAQRR